MKALLRSGQKNKRTGQATLEFALVALLFLGLLFVILDLALLLFVNMTMQHAVREGTRYAVTGRSTGYADWRTAVTEEIRKQSAGFYTKNRNPVITPTFKQINCESATTFPNYTGGTTLTGDNPTPSICMVVSLTYRWRPITPFLRPFFPGGNYTFTVRSTMKTEPFPP